VADGLKKKKQNTRGQKEKEHGRQGASLQEKTWK